MAACAPTGAIGDLGTVHHRANFLPGHPDHGSNRASISNSPGRVLNPLIPWRG
jgi:hypothetical protein